jgi:hypothetical protein
MINVATLARNKARLELIPMSTDDTGYDHATQRRRQVLDKETFRQTMKSSTQFDGETDPGGGDDK